MPKGPQGQKRHLDSAMRMSPAMACGLSDRLWDIGDIVKLIEDAEIAE